MPDSIQGAYLVLLGQIALAASAIFFGVPYCFATDSSMLSPDPPTILYLVFIFAACSLMIANILIGWASARQLVDQKCSYTSKMFIYDLLSIVCFFGMNNVIMLSFGGTFTIDGAPSVKKVLQLGINLPTTAVTACGLYFLTGAFLLTCKFWNYEYYKSLGRVQAPQDARYERTMWIVIMYSFSASVAAVFWRNSLWIQGYLIFCWIALWVAINGHWILRNLEPHYPPTSTVAQAQVAPSAGASGANLAHPPLPAPPLVIPDAKSGQDPVLKGISTVAKATVASISRQSSAASGQKTSSLQGQPTASSGTMQRLSRSKRRKLKKS
jgi:hypothetical protein